MLSKVNHCLGQVIKWMSIVAFAVMLFSSAVQIVCRFILSSPLAWTDEISRYMFVWSTMLGCAYLACNNGHSRVDILINALKGKKKLVVQLIVDLMCDVFFVIMIVGGITMVQVSASSVSPACSIPMSLMYLSVPFAGVVMLLFTTELSLKRVQELRFAGTSSQKEEGGTKK